MRGTVARYIADLADVALKFLELSHWRTTSISSAVTPTDLAACHLLGGNNTGFETELQALQVVLSIE